MDSNKLVDLLFESDAIEEVRAFIQNNPTKLNVVHVKGGILGGDKVKIDGTLLHFSCFNNRPKVVSYLLSQNADVTTCFDFVFFVNGVPADDEAIIIEKVKEDVQGEEDVKMFLDLKKVNGLTAQQIAEKRGYVDIVNLFEQSKREQAARREAAEKEKVITEWFCCISLGTIERENYIKLFIQLGFDDLSAISLIKEKEMKVNFPSIPVGHRKKIWQQIQTLKKNLLGNTTVTTTNIHQNQGNVEVPLLKPTPTLTTSSKESRAVPRREAPTARMQPGRRFIELVPKAPIDQKSVIDCLNSWATSKKLDTFIIDDMVGKIEDFINEGNSRTKSFSLSLCWLYTTDSWVYKEINTLLREDASSIRVLAPYMNGLIKSYNQLGNDQSLFFGTVYRRTKLDKSGIDFYKPNIQFVWSAFTSTSMVFDPTSNFFGDTLFVITVPEDFKKYALNLDSVSPFKEEKEVLLLPNMGYIVKATQQGPIQEYPNITLVIYLVVAYVCLT